MGLGVAGGCWCPVQQFCCAELASGASRWFSNLVFFSFKICERSEADTKGLRRELGGYCGHRKFSECEAGVLESRAGSLERTKKGCLGPYPCS